MYLTVVPVGDGACSILRDDAFVRVMVVDCGTNGNGGIAPERVLWRELGEESTNIDTVVVTHFDADHWKGLQRLPRTWGAHRPTGPVDFRYPALLPGLTGDVQKAFLVFEMLDSVGPITHALDLVGAWREAGVQVNACPRRRGDPDFSGAGGTWTVHWPPEDLDPFYPSTRRAFGELGARVRQLAADVPPFADALEDVERLWFDTSDPGDEDSGRRGEPSTDVAGVEVDRALRTVLTGRELRALGDDLQKYNNMLSLVHSGSGLVNFGDCEGAGLGGLTRLERRHPTMDSSYQVLLAPHHGSHAPRAMAQQRIPTASEAVVSQNGWQRYDDGRQRPQRDFKKRIAEPTASMLDTFDPRLGPSLHTHHHRFTLP